MKSSKEMADSVFQIRDAYLEKKRKRNNRIKKASYIGSMFCLFGVILFGVHYMKPENNQIPMMTIPEVSSSTESTAPSDELADNAMSNTKPAMTEAENETASNIETQEAASSDNLTEEQVTEEHQDVTEQNDLAPESDIIMTEPIQVDTVIPPVDSDHEDTVQNSDTEIVSEPQNDDNTSISTPDDNADNFVEEEDVYPEQLLFSDWTFEELYLTFPEIDMGRIYCCANQTLEKDMIDTPINVIGIMGDNGTSADVVIYSVLGVDSQNEIAVQFAGRNDYIIYQAD